MSATWHGATGAEILAGIEETKAEWDLAAQEYVDQLAAYWRMADADPIRRALFEAMGHYKKVEPVVCYRAAMLVKAQQVARWRR